MKLLHTITSADPTTGGPIEAVRQIGVALERLGVESTVVCGDPPNAAWLDKFPLRIVGLGPMRGSYGFIDDLEDWLVEHGREFDLAVIHGIWQHQSVVTRSAMRRLNLPYAVYPHGMLDPWFRERYPRKHLKKLMYWRFGEYPVLRDAAAVMFTCQEERRLAPLSFEPNVWRDRVVNLGTSGSTGIATDERAAFLARFPDLSATKNVLFLGRVTEKKGLDMLIDAFARTTSSMSDARLVIAGPIDSELRAPLIAQIESLQIAEKVALTGMLSGAEKWGAFRAADVFILPSHQENFGISVAEALSTGLPALVSTKVNIWREIVDGGGGLAEPDTIAGTKALLSQWFAMSCDARAEMRRRASVVFNESFEIKHSAAMLFEALRDITKEGIR